MIGHYIIIIYLPYFILYYPLELIPYIEWKIKNIKQRI